MIPILFEKNATTFTTNGLARLTSCTRCIVTEERNGIYECELDIPVSDPMFNEIQIGRIIACTHDEEGDVQPFDIYMASEPINGIVTFYASHISYRLNEITVEPFSATTCATALAGLKTNSIGFNPFTFGTDKVVNGDYVVKVPSSLRSLMGGVENSILDVYGTGEYKFDKFSVYLYAARGSDTDVTIRYGKNLIDYTDDLDYSETYNGIAPFWLGVVYDEDTETETEVLVTLPEKYIGSGETLPNGRDVIIPLDLSGEFEQQPTDAELRTLATNRLNNSYGWLPNRNITVNFIQLWQTEEYKQYAPLQKVKLCDTVLVSVPMYNVSGLRIKVIKVVWNVLLGRYDEMELGTPQTTFAAAITDSQALSGQVQEIASKTVASTVATNMKNQHFWFTSTGVDTGAHITEVPQDTFLIDPENGGRNIIVTSDGMGVRDGLSNIAFFGENVTLGEDGNAQMFMTSNSIDAYADNGTIYYNMSLSNGTISTRKNESHKIYATSSWQDYDLNQMSGWSSIAVGDNFNIRISAYFEVMAAPQLPSELLVITKGTAKVGTYFKYDGDHTINYKDYPTASGYSGYLYSYIYMEWTETTYGPTYTFGVTDEDAIKGGYSFREGYMNIAKGAYSHAEGYLTQAKLSQDHAEGNQTIADGGYGCHAEGYHTEAHGTASHGEGYYCNAQGSQGAHAEGYTTKAYGAGAHAEGVYTEANGNGTHAGGYYTIADSSHQTAIGEYNIKDSAGTYAFIIGNGTGPNSRSNAMTVAWTGDTAIAGTLTQNSDKRLKEHIDYLDENADKFIRALKPAHYIKGKDHHLGFYAQDVEKVDEWGCLVGEMNGYKTLGYTEIIAPLVAYCQHLEKRIEMLEGGSQC